MMFCSDAVGRLVSSCGWFFYISTCFVLHRVIMFFFYQFLATCSIGKRLWSFHITDSDSGLRDTSVHSEQIIHQAVMMSWSISAGMKQHWLRPLAALSQLIQRVKDRPLCVGEERHLCWNTWLTVLDGTQNRWLCVCVCVRKGSE